ncbi:uncharacterized protein [Leuresthes tenuis]|uniref:uncharacterized protein n=1 Tax=Leuresthes tenuis TaxID=355514 RepID=UPI003B5014EB
MDVYDSLWAKNLDVAEQTLKVPFVQHMQTGDLQADYYTVFMIQDINYLLKVTEMLKEMCEKGKLPEDVRVFMQGRYSSYKEYADDTLEQFNLSGVSDIKPIPAMEKYLSDYKAILNGEEPILFAVALLPCARLWLWLAQSLKEKEFNAYFTWKKNNMVGHPEQHYRKLLDDNLTTAEQKKRANEIFRRQMQNERDFFAASLKAQK